MRLSDLRKYRLENEHGLSVDFLNLGGIITDITLQGPDGHRHEFVVQRRSIQDYIADNTYMGAIIGPFANRIAEASFYCGGRHYRFEPNEGRNLLHGGKQGLHKVVWDVRLLSESDAKGYRLTFDGEKNNVQYPGKLVFEVDYTINDENCLRIDLKAHAREPTHVHLTSHSYFVSGYFGKRNNYALKVNADCCLETDEEQIPTGKMLSVEAVGIDLRKFNYVDNISDPFSPSKVLDRTYVLQRFEPDQLTTVAVLKDQKTGRRLITRTNAPGVQIFIPPQGHLHGIMDQGKEIKTVCIEPQYFPDSPNKPNFPSTLLEPGQSFHSVIEYQFS